MSSQINCRTVKRYFYTSPTGRTKGCHSLFMACKQAAKEELRTIVLGPRVEFGGGIERENLIPFLELEFDEQKAKIKDLFEKHLADDETIPADARRFGGAYRYWIERRAKELAKEWRSSQ